jgi:hypothetical protein
LAFQGVTLVTALRVYFVGDGGDDVVRRMLPAFAGHKSENEYGCEKEIHSA